PTQKAQAITRTLAMRGGVPAVRAIGGLANAAIGIGSGIHAGTQARAARDVNIQRATPVTPPPVAATGIPQSFTPPPPQSAAPTTTIGGVDIPFSSAPPTSVMPGGYYGDLGTIPPEQIS